MMEQLKVTTGSEIYAAVVVAKSNELSRKDESVGLALRQGREFTTQQAVEAKLLGGPPPGMSPASGGPGTDCMPKKLQV